jgi:alkylhydroperoxidase/carboxymuconolactone decarboxylase family protein YurZ
MSDYLPDVYVRFRGLYPRVALALDGLGAATESAGPLDGRTQRLVKLGVAIGGLAEGAVRSNVRRALGAGATPDEVRHVALLAITTTGFPAAIASLGWIEEVLASRDPQSARATPDS